MNSRSNENAIPAETVESLRDELAVCRREIARSRQLIDQAECSRGAEKKEQQRLQAALDTAQIGLWNQDLKDVTLAGEWSPRFREILGVSLDAKATRELFLKCVHPEDREEAERAIMKALGGANGGRCSAEYRIIRPSDGVTRWVMAQGQTFFSPEGKADHLIGTILDVTAGKILAEENVRLQADFRDLFEEAPIPYVHEGVDTRFIRVNRAAMKVLGIKPEEIEGTFGRTLVADTPENQKRMHDALALVGKGREFGPVLLELRRKDNGNPVWVEWWSRPAPRGDYTRTMFWDITDRMRMQRTKAALEFTLESGQVGDWDLDLERGTSRRSLRHDQCFGYNEPIPESEWDVEKFMQHVHPEDRAAVETGFRRAMEKLENWSAEFRVLWPDRSEHWIAARGSVYRVIEGRAARMLGLVMDITERKKSEKILRETKAVLEFTLESAQVGDWDLDLIHDTSRRSLRHDQCFGYNTAIPEAKWGIEVFIQHVHPGDRTRVEDSLRGAAKDLLDWTSEFRVIWPDGSLHWISARGSTYRTKEGKATRMLGIVMDITDRKQAEETLSASGRLARRQVEALTRTLDTLAKEPAPERLMGHILQAITEQFGAHSSSVWRRDVVSGVVAFESAFENGKVVAKTDARFAGMDLGLPMADQWPWPEVFRTGKPSVIDDIRKVPSFALRDRLVSLGIVTVLLIPMSMAGRLEGAIGLRFCQKRTFRDEEIDLGQVLANQAMLAMHLNRLSVESRESAVVAERNRMARDIHDTLAQGFTGVILQLEAAKGAAANNNLPVLFERIEQASDLARSSLGEARRSVQALRPRSLSDGTLFTALDGLLKRMSEGTSLSADFRVEGEPRPLIADWEEALLRVTQESLTNTIKHARARSFQASLSFRPTDIQLRLVDDGRGFELGKETDGFGLIGMKERVTQIGGQFAIRSKAGEGAEILVILGAAKDLKPDSTNEPT
jgi:PAS domain S-box-containing protein